MIFCYEIPENDSFKILNPYAQTFGVRQLNVRIFLISRTHPRSWFHDRDFEEVILSKCVQEMFFLEHRSNFRLLDDYNTSIYIVSMEAVDFSLKPDIGPIGRTLNPGMLCLIGLRSLGRVRCHIRSSNDLLTAQKGLTNAPDYKWLSFSRHLGTGTTIGGTGRDRLGTVHRTAK
ncbi:unnamed protein product [Nesidiocoris tenuis]|uniref:Uncharacterized protein n=1 Tax=Nesidiocoris tenuis TaxID=355587 RepID=A0A6H5GF32_9HEMI|nr:unnamed protein product [Nesidiocoris tenuis]